MNNNIDNKYLDVNEEQNNASFMRERSFNLSNSEIKNIEKKKKQIEELFEKKLDQINIDSHAETKKNDNFYKNIDNKQKKIIKELSKDLTSGNRDKKILKEKKKEELERKKLEKNKKEEEKRRIKEEKRRLKEEKLNEKRIKSEEKKRKNEEDKLLNLSSDDKKESNIILEEKKERKRKEKEQKLKEREQKEEEKKEKLRKKYEEQARIKHEKEQKDIAIIKEKREKERKLKKEREDARKERKEKALLIKKAQEESKEKAKKERKTFKEKLNDFYNNLSFVRDAKNRRELQRQTLLIDFDGEDAVRSEEKILYKYVAKNKETGKVETDYFSAFSKLDVHSFLLAEGYEVYEITPQKSVSKGISFSSPKFNASELDFFLTQLSTFLKSGITLVESVKILSKQCKKHSQKRVYKSIIYELTMGENFSEALSKQGNVFPRLLINMIKASELTGDLPETLDDMANYYKEIEKTKKQMISALTYPAVLLCFAIVVLIFIMVKVIPEFVSIYSNMDSGLPSITVVIIKVSDFLQAYWEFVVAGLIGFILLFMFIYKSIKVFRSVIQSLVMNLPVFGNIIIYNEVTMFTKTFASLLNHNVYITDCMEVLSKITNNEIYKMLIFDTIANLAKGEAISNSFKNHWAFPNIAYEMILTGERTGQLGPMMEKVSNYYQEQHKNAVNQIKAFIEPVMIILLAAIVGIVLLAVVLPMFDMYQNIGV